MILDSLDKGIHIRSDGVVLSLDSNVVRMEEGACHPNLVSLWPTHGKTVLAGMFGLSDESHKVSWTGRPGGRGIRRLPQGARGGAGHADEVRRLPWENEELPEPLGMADRLIRKAIGDGVPHCLVGKEERGSNPRWDGRGWSSITRPSPTPGGSMSR